VLVRLVRIAGSDLSLFEFDLDLTWMAFFLNADEEIYGRYGGRDSKDPDNRQSLAGLRYAMSAALETHRRPGRSKARPRREVSIYVERLNFARSHTGCIHCHQAKEIMREELQSVGKWRREEIWAYPLPDNLGFVLDVDRGNVVKIVQKNSPAEKIGIRAGDMLTMLNGYSVHSFGDAQYALHKAPARGAIAVNWLRADKHMNGTLSLTEGWRKTNVTWRPSLMYLLPSLPLYGKDLTMQEKKQLGLGEKALAIRQGKSVHPDALAFGLRAGDIIVGLNDERPEMSIREFLAHVRQNYLVGDVVTFRVIRDGKHVDLKWTLR
jgi:serine protease Do